MKGIQKRASLWAVLGAVTALTAAMAGTAVNEKTFSLTLPDGYGAFTKQVQKDQKVTTYVSKGEDGGVIIVSHALMAPTEDIDAYLAKERDSLIKSLKATLGPQQQRRIDGKDGLSFRYFIQGAQPMFGRTDLVVADPRLYQVIYLAGSEEAVGSAAVNQMFGSFDLKEAELERVKAEAVNAAKIARGEPTQQ